MESCHVTTGGRIVILARPRRKLGITPGTKVCFDEAIHPKPGGLPKCETSVTEELLKERKKERGCEEATLKKLRAR